MSTDTQIINLFRQFKLGQSLFKSTYRVSKQMVIGSHLKPEDVEGIAARESINVLAKHIIDRHKHAIKRHEYPTPEIDHSSGEIPTIEFRTELLVLEMDNFKTIVEAAIQMIPQHEIDRIKNGETIESL